MSGSGSSSSVGASSLVRWSVTALALTSVHHVYGAIRYVTPWRLHVLFFTIPAILVILWSGSRVRDHGDDARARTWLIGVTLLVTIVSFGIFEGAYNHVAKDALFFCGAPASLMLRLFPPPMYEMPDDFFFEATGIAQAAVTIVVVQRLFAFRRRRSGRLAPGQSIESQTLSTSAGESVVIPDPLEIIHLQFRRFAGCPVCDLHLHAFARRHSELASMGIREVVVFHSTADAVDAYTGSLPFAIVPDPEKRLYFAFGVETGARALLDPRAWLGIMRGVVHAFAVLLFDRAPLPPLDPPGGRTSLPADFLIAPGGRLLASHYGAHVDDAWSVDDVLERSRGGIIT